MNTYEITMEITVSGFGKVEDNTKPVKRTIQAEGIEAAIELAKKDILQVKVVKAVDVTVVGVI